MLTKNVSDGQGIGFGFCKLFCKKKNVDNCFCFFNSCEVKDRRVDLKPGAQLKPVLNLALVLLCKQLYRTIDLYRPYHF